MRVHQAGASLAARVGRVVSGVAVGGLLLGAVSAWAAYPDKTITLIAPYPAGGSSDNVARIVAPLLGERLKQPVIVEDISGAGGAIGTQRVVRAEADGYTILLGSGSEILVNKLINPGVAYDGLKDLAPVALIGSGPMVLLGKSQLAADNVSDLLALIRARPGQLNYASAGNGTLMHLTGELLKMRGNLQMTHVPYRGSPPALTDLMGGQVDLAISTLSAAQAAIQSGKVKVFAVTSQSPSELAPNVPPLGTVAGLQGFDVGVWFGLFMPARTPAAIVKQVEEATLQVLNDPTVRKRLFEQGVIASGAPAEALRKLLVAETEKYQAVIKAAGITAAQ